MKKTFIFVFCLLPLLITTIVSCTTNPSNAAALQKAQIPEKSELEVEADKELYYEHIFRFYPLLDADHLPLEVFTVRRVGDFVYAQGHVQSTVGVSKLCYNNIGEYQEATASNYSGYFLLLEDGTQINVVTEFKRFMLAKGDPESEDTETTDAYPVGQSGGEWYIETFGDDCIIVSKGYDMYIFRGFYEVPVYVDLPCVVQNVERISDDILLIFNREKELDTCESLYHTVNMKTGEVEEFSYTDDHPDPKDFIKKAVNIICRYGIYYGNRSDGLYKLEDGVETLVCSWEESGFKSIDIELLEVMRDDSFLIRYRNQLLSTTQTGFLVYEMIERSTPRAVVTMASVGLNGDFRQFLNAAVGEFNRQNDDYMIYYKDYNDLPDYHWLSEYTKYDPNEKERELAQNEFEMDLIEGRVYDCYIFPEDSPNRKLLADKNALIDLSPYVEENQLLGCVLNAFTQNSKVIALPFFMTMKTMVTTQNILSSHTPLTQSIILDMANALAQGEALFSEYNYEDIKDAALYEFLDYDGKSCSFDSQQFINYLPFLKAVYEGSYVDESLEVLWNNTSHYGYHSLARYQEYILVNENAQNNIASKKLKFYQWEFYVRDSLSALMLAYHQQNINYCGYPYENGAGILLNTEALFSATTVSEHPEGAAAFLQFMLSKEIQTDRGTAKFGFPVTMEGIQQIFPIGYNTYIYNTMMLTRPKAGNWYLDGHEDSIPLLIGNIRDEYPTEEQMKYSSIIQCVNVTQDDCDLFIRFLNRAQTITVANQVIHDIVDEELSYYFEGIRGAEDTARIIQSRVNLYLNE